jgi:hypothetical protein
MVLETIMAALSVCNVVVSGQADFRAKSQKLTFKAPAPAMTVLTNIPVVRGSNPSS